MLKLAKPFRVTLSSLALMAGGGALALALPYSANAQTGLQFRQKIAHDAGKCTGSGPAVRINISKIEAGGGKIRVQLYRGNKADWLESGRWIHRIEMPAQTGTMSVCMPVPSSGTYGIAIRHDVNGNGKTDLTQDGGGMSNNPSINIFNLGKPGYKKTAFAIGNEVKSMSIRMRYL